MLMAEGPSVQIERKPEKAAQPAEVKFVLPFEPERLRGFIDGLARPENPPTTAAPAASNVIATAELIAFLQKGRPRKDDPNLELYNRAIATFANDGKVESAILTIGELHLASIRNLHAVLMGGEKLEGRDAETIYLHLRSINEDLDSGGRNFLKDDDRRILYLREKIPMVGIMNAISTGEAIVSAPTELYRPAEKVQLPPIKVSLQDILANLHPIEGLGSLPVLTYSAEVPSTVLSMFTATVDDPDAQAKAQAAMNGVAAGYAVLINSPDDSGAATRASQMIYDALSKIPADKVIWASEAFTKALGCFKSGNLKGGLDLMAGEPAMDAIYDGLKNTYTLTISERALSVFKGGTTFRYEFDSKVNAYQEYQKEGKRWSLLPLAIGMALYYESLDLVGQLTQLKASRDAQGALTVTPENTAITGKGTAATAIPQATFGTILWKKPVEFTFYCTVGYRKYDLGKDITLEDGTTKSLDVGKEGAFLGIYGIDANVSKAFGALDKPIFRVGRIPVGFERAGVANVGEKFNPIAYMTFSSLMMEKNQWRVQLFVKPEVRYLLKQFSTGLEIKPEATYQPAGKNVTFFGAPVFRFEWNYGNSSYVYDLRAMLGTRFLEGTQVYLDFARTAEMNADVGRGMPSGWTAALKADINISSFFRKNREGKLGGLKPSRK